MPLKRGAPKGSKNRLKHGRYSAASIAQRKLVRKTIRSARLALLTARVELADARAVAHGQK
jgi:hypothetical protein